MPFTNEFSPFFYQFLQFSPQILKSLSAPSTFTFLDRRVGCSQEHICTAFGRGQQLATYLRDPRRNGIEIPSRVCGSPRSVKRWTHQLQKLSIADRLLRQEKRRKIAWLLVLTLLNAQTVFFFHPFRRRGWVFNWKWVILFCISAFCGNLIFCTATFPDSCIMENWTQFVVRGSQIRFLHFIEVVWIIFHRKKKW